MTVPHDYVLLDVSFKTCEDLVPVFPIRDGCVEIPMDANLGRTGGEAAVPLARKRLAKLIAAHKKVRVPVRRGTDILQTQGVRVPVDTWKKFMGVAVKDADPMFLMGTKSDLELWCSRRGIADHPAHIMSQLASNGWSADDECQCIACSTARQVGT